MPTLLMTLEIKENKAIMKYYIDGKRATFERYEALRFHPHHDGFITKSKAMPNGTNKYYHYSQVRG